MTLIRPVT